MLDELARALEGEVVVPGSPAYEQRPRPFNARFDDVVPEAVVRCASADDVAETVAFVRARGLELAIRSGGHCFAGRSVTRGVLFDVSPMRAVSVSHGLARIEAGATLGEVYLGLIEHGVTMPGGTCPSVGIAGLTLGGGLGILGRRYGVTSDRLVGATVVLADGRIVGCDEHREADLFWALRGGGTGHLGVVTELAFRPVPVPERTTDFRLTWSFADAAVVARAWMDRAPVAPDELAASLVVAASAEPGEGPTVEVFGTALGTRSDATGHLEALVGGIGADPASEFVDERSYAETLAWWAERAGGSIEAPRAPAPSRSHQVVRSEFFDRPLPDDAIAALFDHLARDRVAGQTRELDLSPWGGAYNRVDPHATAFVHRTARFSLKHAATVNADASAAERGRASDWADRSWASVRPWGNGGVFPNFADPDLEDWGRAYYGSNLERLREVKRRYDPDDLFRVRQSLSPR